MTERPTTIVSADGRITLPDAIRQALGWQAGTRLAVENTPEGVLLKAVPVFSETRLEEVLGMLAYRGTPKSLADMDAGVLAEAKRRFRA